MKAYKINNCSEIFPCCFKFCKDNLKTKESWLSELSSAVTLPLNISGGKLRKVFCDSTTSSLNNSQIMSWRLCCPKPSQQSFFSVSGNAVIGVWREMEWDEHAALGGSGAEWRLWLPIQMVWGLFVSKSNIQLQRVVQFHGGDCVECWDAIYKEPSHGGAERVGPWFGFADCLSKCSVALLHHRDQRAWWAFW